MADERRDETIEQTVARLTRDLTDLRSTTLARIGGSVRFQSARPSGSTTLTTSVQSISGSTISFDITGESSLLVIAKHDIWVETFGTGYCYGFIYVDGVVADTSLMTDHNAEYHRSAMVGFYQDVIAAGSHSVNLRTRKDINAGDAHYEGPSAILIGVGFG